MIKQPLTMSANKQVDDIDGDILIRTTGNEIIRCHSEVLNMVSNYFTNLTIKSDNVKMLDDTMFVDFEYQTCAIEIVFKELYRIYYGIKPDSFIMKKLDKLHDYDLLSILNMIQELALKVNVSDFHKLVIECLINKSGQKWLEILIDWALNYPEIIQPFMEEYRQYPSKLDMVSLDAVISIKNKDLANLILKNHNERIKSIINFYDGKCSHLTSEVQSLREENKRLLSKLNNLSKQHIRPSDSKTKRFVPSKRYLDIDMLFNEL